MNERDDLAAVQLVVNGPEVGVPTVAFIDACEQAHAIEFEFIMQALDLAQGCVDIR